MKKAIIMTFKQHSSILRSIIRLLDVSKNNTVSKYSVILFLAFFLVLGSVHSIKLDTDGGYSLLIGVDSNVSESETDLKNLIQSIEDKLSDLSERMNHATQRFYIKNVDILLRSHSDLVDFDADAVSEDYKTADFQISRNVQEPEVVNPNGCGLPGNRLSLPLESFDLIISGKTLLHLFARYRWGVFEEDGSANDPERYPRFYRTTNEESSWVHTVCSDAPLVGSFESSQEGETCDTTNLEDYPSNCNFVPAASEEQTAVSSLMNYYWLDSINEFCNESTHNVFAPNRQNILCNYRSTMEVIRGTTDWSVASELPEFVPPKPVFRVLKVSQKPRLYFLIDRGWSFAPEEVITKVKTRFAEMLQSLDSSIVVGIGAFPANSPDSYVDNVLEWSLLGNVKNISSEIIDKSFASGIQGNRRIANALLQLTKNIEATDHPLGTVIVILKAGPADSFENAPHEYDLIASLGGLSTKIYALEIKGNDAMPAMNLVNFMEKLGGLHAAIDDVNSADEKLDEFTQSVVEQLGTPSISAKIVATVYKGYVYSGSTYELELGPNLNSLQVSLTSSSQLKSVEISLSGVAIHPDNSTEWNDTSIDGKREVHYGSTNSDTSGAVSVSFGCKTNEACTAFLVVTGDQDEVINEELVSVEISTSSLKNDIDWSRPDSLIQPFHIYAKVSKSDDSRVVDITGIVCPIEGDINDCQTIPMVDDGLGDPDTLRNDGVYSFTFMPRNDDRFHVKVVCTVDKEGESETLRAVRTFDYSAFITFTGVSNFQPIVRRVVDLRVAEKSDESVILTWTSPVIHGLDTKDAPADSYELRYTNETDYTLLLRNFDSYPLIPSPADPVLPGETETVTVEMNDSNERFFAIRALYSIAKGEVSNVVSSAFGLPTPTNPPTSTTEIHTSTGESSTTQDPTTTTTQDPTTTTEDPTTTTQVPKTTTTEDPTTTTTEDPTTTTTEDPTTTTQDPTTTTQDPTTTTEDPTTTTEEDPTTTTEEDPTTTTEDPTTTTEDPTTTTEDPTTTTEEDPTTTTEEDPTTTTEEDPTTTTDSSSSDSTPQSSTPSFTRPTTPPITTPELELFFKKPIGYITAAVGGVAVVTVVGGSVGYLYWKRKRLIDLGRLKLV